LFIGFLISWISLPTKTTKINMFVNYLILIACVRMTEMFISENILTTYDYGNQIYFQWHASKCCINISLLKYNTPAFVNLAEFFFFYLIWNYFYSNLLKLIY
jgi:hypothetical protein